MLIKVLKSKIHRATVTEADVAYIGSIGIDRTLCEAVGLVEHEAVLVADVDNGVRLETYVQYADPGSGTICMNGAAAKLVSVGDVVIIFGFGYLSEEELAEHKPRMILADAQNRVAQEL